MALRRAPRLAVVVLACAGLAVACGGKKGSGVAPTPTGKPTTTMAGVGPVAALTGLPLADDAVRNRPVLVVKVDNHPEARPQFGLDHADDVVEEKVEGGLSRFMAIFQSEDADRVGPVRSLRSTDPAWLKPEGGMIAYSGGIDPVKALLKPNGIVDLGADSHGTKYYKRRSDRPYEHSMYVSTPVLRELTPNGLPAPKPLFDYVGPGGSFGGSTATPVSGISGRMDGGSTAETFAWDWDATAKRFVRTTDGKAHDIEGVGRIAMSNVIVQFTPYRATPWRDRANSPVDEAVVTGEGDAWVLSDGKLVRGHWSRPDPGSITTYTDSTGAPVKLLPGHSWVMLVPTGQPVEVH